MEVVDLPTQPMPSSVSSYSRSRSSRRSRRSRRSRSTIGSRVSSITRASSVGSTKPYISGVHAGVPDFKARGLKSRRLNKHLSLRDMIAPMCTYKCKGYGLDTLTRQSMKHIAFAAGKQDVRLMITLPAIKNYFDKQQVEYATQYGETPSIDDLLKKTSRINPISAMTRALIYYPGSAFNPQVPLDKEGLLSTETPSSLAPYTLEHFRTMTQCLDFYGGSVTHYFENCNDTPIFIELTEIVPKVLLNGGILNNGGSDVDPVIINDPVHLALTDYAIMFNANRPPYGQGPELDPKDYLQDGTVVANDDGTSGTAVQTGVAMNTALYNGTTNNVNLAGTNDPQFKITAKCKLTLMNYKVAKSKSVRLEPGAKYTYIQYIPAFSFSSSEWNTIMFNYALSASDKGQDSNGATWRPNFVPMFTKFLMVRSKGATTSHQFGAEMEENDATAGRVASCGGAYIHTQSESYKWRLMPDTKAINYNIFHTNLTDGAADVFENKNWHHINQQTYSDIADDPNE